MVITKNGMTDMTANCKPTFLSFFQMVGIYLDFSREDAMRCL